MNEAIELLRSAYQIAQRQGKDTNWIAFEHNLKRELLRQSGHVIDDSDDAPIMFDDNQIVLRATCTLKTYRLYPINQESMYLPGKGKESNSLTSSCIPSQDV